MQRVSPYMKMPTYPGNFIGQCVGTVRYRYETGKMYLLRLNEFTPDETVIRKMATGIAEYPAWIWDGSTWEKPTITERTVDPSFDKAAASKAFREIMGRGQRVNVK